MTRSRSVIRPVSLRRFGRALAAGAVTTLMATAAHAQEAATDDAEDLGVAEYQEVTADSNPYTQKGAPYKARVSGDERRVKPLAETPATITAITQSQLQEAGRSDLRNILASQPGITIGTGENGNAFGDRYIIRGQEAKSAVYVDGMLDPGLQSRETFAIEQLEITKGPSATFAGRGAQGGAVNAITKQASTDYSFHAVDVTGGTDSHGRAALDSNVRLSDTLAVRANLMVMSEDVPDRDPARRQRFGAALAVKGQLSETVSAKLDYYHLTVRDRQDLGQAIANVASGGQPFTDIPAYAQKDDFQNARVNVLTGRLRVAPFEGFSIENTARYGKISNGYVNTAATRFTRGANDPAAPGAVDVRLNASRAGWQEIDFFGDRLNIIGAFETGGMKHALAAGVEYMSYSVDNRFGQVIVAPGASAMATAASGYAYAITGAANCINGTGTVLNAYCLSDGKGTLRENASSLLNRTGVSRSALPATIWQVDTLSGYLMDSVDVTEWLTLNGGIRFDSFDYRLRANSTATGVQTSDYNFNGTLWSYNAGITLKPAEDGIIYAAWGTGTDINGGESDVGTNCGYGGLCSVTDPVTGQIVFSARPERSENIEIGTKWEFFDQRLMLTAAAFRTSKKDLMEGLNADSYSLNGGLNSGALRVQGLEFGLVGSITEQLSGQVVASFAKSKVTKTLNPGLTPAQLAAGATNLGKRLANFANNGVDAQLRWQASERLALGGSVTYKSAMYGGQPDTAAAYVSDPASAFFGQYSIRIPAYTSFGAFVSFKINDQLTARVNAVNLTDKRYYTAAYRSGSFAYLGDGRTVRVTLSGKF
jgi:catecholate siderophore receptor